MSAYWRFFFILLVAVSDVSAYEIRPPDKSLPVAPSEPEPNLLKGAMIEMHPRQGLTFQRSVIGRMVDTTGSPWPYRIHQKKGLDWYQKPVAFVYSGYFKALKEGWYTFGTFIEQTKKRRHRSRIKVKCAVSVCLDGELKIEHRKQSYQSRHPPSKRDKMQLAYFISDLLAPGYYRLSIAIACDGARRPEVLDRLRLSMKVKSPSNTVMSDVTPEMWVHKRKPDATDAKSACAMTER